MACYWDIDMSVINQMLKDLDKRQSEQAETSHLVLPVSTKSSVGKWVWVVVAIIILNVAGIFTWQLYSENQQLRAQARQDHTIEVTGADVEKAPIKNVSITASSQEVRSNLTTEPTEKFITSQSDDIESDLPNRELSVGLEPESKLVVEKPSTTPVVYPVVVDDSAVVIVTAVETDRNSTKPESIVVKTKVKPKLTISRTQLSSKELAANKISEAEQAIERNDIIKAESLFEEVLLLIPEHETARKQLAALWYGKKSYQNAINLLSQGIALAPKAEEMRLMSARIYYEQGQAGQAYNILSPLKRSSSKEVQVLLANTAAELNEHDNAISAYKNLIALEPKVSRWWLGLAISLDSLGDFISARDAYQQAIKRNNLSSSAMQFARQRLFELGE
ncbi:tetratricopeptide repeat protein [Colwellia sp. Arc7-635]|nr:tetratricopeptide repeat protein [Colwellia sp. Arc7-635]